MSRYKPIPARVLLACVGIFALLLLAVIVSRPQGALSWPALRNATYPSQVRRTHSVTLVDGAFQEPAAPGSASLISARLADVAAFGRLPGGDQVDAAVVVVESGGGTGVFASLVAVRNDGGIAHPIASAALGDRVSVRGLTIVDGAISARMRVRSEGDPLSHLTREVTRRYALRDQTLVLLEERTFEVPSTPPDQFVYAPRRLSPQLNNASSERNTLRPGGIDTYLIHAEAGEELAITVASEFNNAVLSVLGLSDGLTLVSRSDYSVRQLIATASTQDLAVRVVSLAGYDMSYLLTVAVRAAAQATSTPAPAPVSTPRPPSSATPPLDPALRRPLAALSVDASTFLSRQPPAWGVAVVGIDSATQYLENGDEQMPTASSVKLLVMMAVLSQAIDERRYVGEDELALLWPMITESDNDATTELWRRIGGGQALASYLARIGVSGFTMDSGEHWGVTFGSARGLATAMAKLGSPDILDAPSRALALRLLAGVVTQQRWGVATAAAAGALQGLKNGWYPGDEGWRVISVGLVRSPAGGRSYAIAVVTDGQTSFEAGLATIEGVSSRIGDALGTR